MADTAPSTPPSPLHAQAASAVERLINNRIFQPNPQAQPQFLALKADMGIGLAPSLFGLKEEEKQQETLRITLRGAQLDVSPAAISEHVLKTLSETPLKNVAAFGSEKENFQKLQEKLTGFIAHGADLPKNVLAWRGFSQDLKENFSGGIEDHALQNIRVSDSEIAFRIAVPATKSEDNVTVTGVQQLETNLLARLPQIRQVLAQWAVKHSTGLNDAQKQQLMAAVGQLDIKLGRYESEYSNEISVTITSPQQKAVDALEGKQRQNVDMRSLRATNVLSNFSKEQIGKILGHSFLNGGDAAADVFPLIAGRKDMHRAIEESLGRLKGAKPQLASEIDAFLADDAFKAHSWQERDKLKQTPLVNKDPAKPGEMTIDFTLPAGQAAAIMGQLAALGPAQSAPNVSHAAPPAVQTEMARILERQAQPPAAPGTQLNDVPQVTHCGCNPPLTAA